MKKNYKGFTLIELIVVIAILGILAAILIPSMIGYIRNSRIAQANANAKEVHNAVSAGLAQMAIARIELSSTTIQWTNDPTGNCSVDGFDLELELYVGKDFKGTAFAEFSKPETYAVDYATWVIDGKTPETHQATELEQKNRAKTNDIFGVYPFAST